MSKPTADQLDLIFQNTHYDFKGVFEDGTRAILARRGRSRLVALEDLSPEEVTDNMALIARDKRQATMEYVKSGLTILLMVMLAAFVLWGGFITTNCSHFLCAG